MPAAGDLNSIEPQACDPRATAAGQRAAEKTCMRKPACIKPFIHARKGKVKNDGTKAR